MTSRGGSPDVAGERSTSGPLYQRLLLNRRALLWLHITLGVTVGLIYIHRMWVVNSIPTKYNGILALIPFGISYGYVSRVVTASRVLAVAFALVLVSVSLAVVWVLSNYLDRVGFMVLLMMLGAQTGVYLLAADLLWVRSNNRWRGP